jgi:hypothetical protein
VSSSSKNAWATTAPPLAQKHQGIRTPRHPATRRRIARQRRKRLANFFAEDARLNPARNTIRPIENRKKFLPDLQLSQDMYHYALRT